MNWQEFEDSYHWRTIAQTVRDRMRLIISDLLKAKPEDVSSLQAEHKTCEFFLALPGVIAQTSTEGEIEDETDTLPTS